MSVKFEPAGRISGREVMTLLTIGSIITECGKWVELWSVQR
jgi:hypothetical protein